MRRPGLPAGLRKITHPPAAIELVKDSKIEAVDTGLHLEPWGLVISTLIEHADTTLAA